MWNLLLFLICFNSVKLEVAGFSSDSLKTTLPGRTTISSTSSTSTHIERSNWFLRNGFQLSKTRLKSGAWPVQVAEWKYSRLYGPVCEDGFNDWAAKNLCETIGYDRGYRTTYQTEEEFFKTEVVCFTDFSEIFGFVTDRILSGNEHCDMKSYRMEGLPCSKNQALAVFCYDQWIDSRYEPYDFEFCNDTMTFTVAFSLRLEKLGKIFELVGKKALKGHSIINDFGAVICGKDVRVKWSGSLSKYELKGKFNQECNSPKNFFRRFRMVKDFAFGTAIKLDTKKFTFCKSPMSRVGPTRGVIGIPISYRYR